MEKRHPVKMKDTGPNPVLPANLRKPRHVYFRKYQKVWLQKRRIAWILENGPCQKCGSNKNLEVDHIDRRTKEIKSSSIWSRKKEVRDIELAKCQVLCKKCHKKKTLKELTKRTHGSEQMYKYGCRCRKCTKAKTKAVNEWRWRTGRRRKRI